MYFLVALSSLLHGLSLVAVSRALHHRVWASHCDGFSSCGAQALDARVLVVVALRLYSMGSVIVVPGLVAL